MPLSIPDCTPGTIVDHTYERVDGRTVLRPVRRRGIIVEVDGNGTDSVSRIAVQFKPDTKPENVAPAECDRVLHWEHPKARQAFDKVRGISRVVGAEFEEKVVKPRPKVEDALGLTARQPRGPVAPEGGHEDDEK